MPVTTTLKVAWAVVHPAVRVAVFGVGRVTDAGAIVAVHPVGIVEVMARLIVPANPFRAFAVIVEVLVLGGV